MRPPSARTAASRMRQTEPWSRPRRAEVPSGVARVPMFLTASEVEITGASDHAARAACCSQDAGLGVRRAFLRSDDAQELKPRYNRSSEKCRPDPIEGAGRTCGVSFSVSDLVAAGLAG